MRIGLANASVYALMNHCSSSTEAPELLVHHGQGVGHHEVVERGHEHREGCRGDDEREGSGPARSASSERGRAGEGEASVVMEVSGSN